MVIVELALVRQSLRRGLQGDSQAPDHEHDGGFGDVGECGGDDCC